MSSPIRFVELRTTMDVSAAEAANAWLDIQSENSTLLIDIVDWQVYYDERFGTRIVLRYNVMPKIERATDDQD